MNPKKQSSFACLTVVLFCNCTGFQDSADYDPLSQRPDPEINTLPYSETENIVPQGPVLHFPFPKTYKTCCVETASSSLNRADKSMRYNLNFDTSDFIDEPIYSPVSGEAYVHCDSEESFGCYVNIDLGDGTYLSVGSLKQVFINNSVSVGAGQLIGFEGCNDSCANDHIRLGRHKGNAWKKIEFSESIPAYYWVWDITADTDYKAVSSQDFVCDFLEGHKYASGLPVICSHPNGSLIKTQNDSKIYLIEKGRSRCIVSEEIFQSIGYDMNDVVIVSENELLSYQPGMEIDLPGTSYAAYDQSDDQLWLFVGSHDQSDRYRIRVQDMNWLLVLNSWGIFYSEQEDPPTLRSDNQFFTNWPIQEGYATFRDGTLLHERTSPQVYVVSDKNALAIDDWDTYVMMGFEKRRIFDIRDNTLHMHFDEIGSCAPGRKGCITSDLLTECGAMR